MENKFLESLRKKEALCRNYQAQANEIMRRNNGVVSEDQCRLLQMAADIEFEMSQVTMGADREHHEREKNRLDYEIIKIRKELSKEKVNTGKESDTKGASDGEAKRMKETEGKSKDEEALDRLARTWYKEAPKHSFEDVSGMHELKKKLQDCLSDAKLQMLFDYLKIPSLNSYFFVGPPGCGKTFIVEAFAHELMDKEYKYLSLQGSDIISRYVGDAEKIVTRLFEEAEKNAPCIVFIDEIDSVCKNRSLPNLPEYAANITTSFLTGYNRINSADLEIIFIGATNYPERVDVAMLDRVEVIRVPLPDQDARKANFEKKFSDIITLEDGFSYDEMAARTDGYNYRDTGRVANAILKMIFKEVMENSKDQYEAIGKLRNGVYRLKRSTFEQAIETFKPSPKEDIIRAIDEWENQYNQLQE